MDVQLAVDLAQVKLDRLGGQEQVRRDVAIGRAALHRRGHAQLLRGQGMLVPLPPTAGSGGAQLGLGLAGPGVRMQPLEALKGGSKPLAGLGAATGPV